MFRILPAIDIRGGKCVQLQQGDPDRTLFETDDPVRVAEDWLNRGARALHVVDLDGAFEGRLKNEDVILEIAELSEVQVGGGIRSGDLVERLIKRGVDRVIVGTMAVENVEEVRELIREYPGCVMVAIDSRNDEVVVNGWRKRVGLSPLELAKLYDDLETSFLLTDVNVEGLMRGIRVEFVRRVVESVENDVFVSGGVSSYEDAKLIKEVGAKGVVVGSALYLGKVRLEDLLRLEE